MLFNFVMVSNIIMNVDESEGKGLGKLLTCKRHFTYKEIVSITRNFQQLIGQGEVSEVYHGRLEDGVEVAIKKMKDCKFAYDEVDSLSLLFAMVEIICMDITNSSICG